MYLGESRTIYVNVDSPNLGFPYFNFLGEAQCKTTPCINPPLCSTFHGKFFC